MTNENMNPIDRINLVAMKQDRQLFEKRCEVQELERVKKDLGKILSDLKKENEEKQRKLDEKREYNNKMRINNERFKRHLKLIDEHNELLEERNIRAEENWSKELSRYENLVKTSAQKEQEHIKVYEQSSHVQEQKQWFLKLEIIKIQLVSEQIQVIEQKKMNMVMHRIQQDRLNKSIVQFVERVMSIWKHQDKFEQAKIQKQALVVRLNSMKEKIALHQSRSMQLEFQVPQAFLEQVGNVSNTIPCSFAASSLKKLESNLIHTLSKFTDVTKVTDSVPRNKISSLNKEISQFSQISLQKSNDLIKKLSQITALRAIRSSKDEVLEAKNQHQNFKPTNIISKDKVSLQKKEVTNSMSDFVTLIQTKPLTKQNMIPEKKSSPGVLKRKRPNSEMKPKASVAKTKNPDVSESHSNKKQMESVEPKESTNKINEKYPKVAPNDKKVRFDQNLPQVLNVEVIKSPKKYEKYKIDVTTHETTNSVEKISVIENESVSSLSDKTADQEGTQNTIKNYDIEMAAAQAHMSSILERSPEYPVTIESFGSPEISSNESEINENIINIPSVERPKTSTKTTFSIFGRKSSDKSDKSYRLF